VSDSKRRKLAHPETYGTKNCPGAGIRPRTVAPLPRTVKFMPVMTVMTMPRKIARAALAIKRRRDLVNPVATLSRLLNVDPVTAKAWLNALPTSLGRPRLRTSGMLSSPIPEMKT
jgi:hypothetical protein